VETVDVEEKNFEPLQVQIRIERELPLILKLRGKERMEAILSSDHPQEIFQSLPEEEAYFTIKEIGEEDALPILTLMSPEQCQYLLDLELWKGYQIQTMKIERWLPLLLSCDEGTIDRWLRNLDFETLLLILKKTIRLHLKENEESTLPQTGGDGYFTLDGIYYIEVLSSSLHDQIEKLLRILAASDLNLYWKVLYQVNEEIEAELEERTLHFREARLEERGFPPMEEALSLYQYLNPDRLKKMLEQREIHLPEILEKVSPPSFPMILRDQNMFFSLCLRDLEEGPLVDRLKMELTYMANQVMVADQPERIDISTIHGSLRKVGGYLSIGLEVLSEGNPHRAREYIEQLPLKFIFQVGFGASLELKWRAEKVWQNAPFSGKGIPLCFLGSPWEEAIEGLLKKRPLFYDQVEMGYREFRSLEEIRSLHRDLDRIELVGKVLSSVAPFSYSDGLLWKTVLLKAYFHDELKLSSQDMPNALGETIPLLNKLRPEEVDIRDSFKRWLLQKIEFKPNPDAILLNEITTSVLEEIGP
jgi:hypothetical protein